MASRAFRARPLDVNKPLDIVTDMSLLDNGGEGLPARDVVHNHAALDAENEKVGTREDFGRGDARWGACKRAIMLPPPPPAQCSPPRRRSLCCTELALAGVVVRMGRTVDSSLGRACPCGKPPCKAKGLPLAAVVAVCCIGRRLVSTRPHRSHPCTTPCSPR